MKQLSLILLLSILLILFACGQKKEAHMSAEPESSQSGTNDMKLPYLDELENQKNDINNQLKIWAAKIIHTDPTESIVDLSPSADGNTLLYVTHGKGFFYIYQLHMGNDSYPRLLYKDKRKIFWAKFHPNQQSVYFSIEDGNQAFHLQSVELNKPIDQIPTRLFHIVDKNIDKTDINVNGLMAISSNTRMELDPDNLITVIRENTQIHLKENDTIFKSLEKAYTPAWSFSGKSLVFISEEFGQPEIAIYDLQQRGIRRISSSTGKNLNPQFAGNDQWIIYSSAESGKNEIYLLNLKNERPIRITNMKDMSFYKPLWSNAGKIYAIGKKENQTFLFQFNNESKLFQVQINGEPGPQLNQVNSPSDHAEKEIKNN